REEAATAAIPKQPAPSAAAARCTTRGAPPPERQSPREGGSSWRARLFEILNCPDFPVRRGVEAARRLRVVVAVHDVVVTAARSFVPHRLEAVLDHRVDGARPPGAFVLPKLVALAERAVRSRGARVGLRLRIGARLGRRPALVRGLAVHRAVAVDL